MEEWFEQSIVARESLGLYDSANRLWVITVPEKTDTWFIKDIHLRHPFYTVYTIIKTTTKVLGYVDWDTLFEICNGGLGGYLRLDMLITTFPQILMYPWETFDDAVVETVTTSSDYRTSAWARKNHVEELIRLDDNPSKRLKRPDPMHDGARTLSKIVLYLASWKYAKTHNKKQIADKMWVRDTETHDLFKKNVELGIKTEKEMLKLLSDNEYNFKDRSKWCAPTPLDIQCFMLRNNLTLANGPSSIPSIMLVVPYEEMSQPPLYEGGFSHISWKEVPQYLWSKQYHFEEVILPHKLQVNIAEECGGDIDKYQEGQLRDLVEDVIKVPEKKKIVTTTQQQESTDVVDIEELSTRGCPGCMRSLLNRPAPQHFKHEERTALAFQLVSGKVPLATADIIFERAFGDNKNAWSHKDIWEKLYIGPECSVYINNATNNSLNTMQCPHVKDYESSPQIACAEEFAQMNFTKSRPFDKMKRPYQWILWYYSRK